MIWHSRRALAELMKLVSAIPWAFAPGWARMKSSRCPAPALGRAQLASARVAGAMTTAPEATATRSVSGFSPTSTMRAAPAASKWVSFFFAIT